MSFHVGAQAMCEMLTIVGKKLEEVTKDKKRLDGYFAILEKWGKIKVDCLPCQHAVSILCRCASIISRGNMWGLQACRMMGVMMRN